MELWMVGFMGELRTRLLAKAHFGAVGISEHSKGLKCLFLYS
jgi:hypothetical protein